MPPKAKFTKEEIVDAAFRIVRESGWEALSSRALGKRLGSSARPVFTVFKSMDEVQQAVVEAAKALYKEYVSRVYPRNTLSRASDEVYSLFGKGAEADFSFSFMREQPEIPDLKGVLPLIEESYEEILLSIRKDYGISRASAEKLYRHLWIYTHGIATLCVTKTCRFTGDEISSMITEVCMSILKDTKEKDRD